LLKAVTKAIELEYDTPNALKELSMKDKPLTVTLHIGGKQVDKLTPDQSERMAQRLSEAMSLYYTAHPEEYKRIKTRK
jgi:hypothetical protein